MEQQELIPHLFRNEYTKITAVLCKRFGFEHIEAAEDIASDTFLTAAQTWVINGVPANPVAWLYNVAGNKAKNFLKRQHLFQQKIAPALKNAPGFSEETGIDLSPQNISDSQLQMMFAVCDPCIPAEAQIGLALRILCGFGINEIADAFLTNTETINKRLSRAKEKLRQQNVTLQFPAAAAADARLANVLTTIYLLFSEGYYSESTAATVRKDLCLEAMRLCSLLTANEHTNTAPVNALLALMCFHASRFDARVGTNGEMILYDEQDTSLWNTDLVAKGTWYLHRAATGKQISTYHIEATIAYWHTQKEDTPEKWETILQLYNRLLQIAYSPVAALNRTYALAKANGKAAAIKEALQLNLHQHHFYFVLLGELYTGVDEEKARRYFEQALALAKTSADKSAIMRRIQRL
ncbi:RNA polymerase subunit sigma [Panacibacter sp. DH6]|uniref:RNA polymerase subunit sigma n=1 Tax=Panacibacter microcysteis TaxID=2793269 RepID=A0A931E1I2_9BACT|nr:DUF6596 domain-containing protein [Panacibacter microcysteis]MBG9375348.1 RNA polymerase subunit sigma [Panacibacter microcysteis]